MKATRHTYMHTYIHTHTHPNKANKNKQKQTKTNKNKQNKTKTNKTKQNKNKIFCVVECNVIYCWFVGFVFYCISFD